MSERIDEQFLFEEAAPNPEYLIKSIAEQGYSLETALADLIDNSISAGANKVEILTDVLNADSITLFIADNGRGMTQAELALNMKFPSSSVDQLRSKDDLGRFGLGLKTASFSQTRKFTVISRKGEGEYNGRTWNVGYLKQTGSWRIIVNTSEEIEKILDSYKACTENFNSQFDDYSPNTLIVWQGLYKYDNFIELENKAKALVNQLEITTREYLGIVFHRFMQKKDNPLKIRINHWKVEYFDPFPIEKRSDIREIGVFERSYKGDIFRVEGFVLPSISINEEKKQGGWVTPNRNLMDLEGIYIYRGDRIIYFGGWNGIINREANLKLARLKVDVGNINDDILQLNVAKSKISIPFELQRGFLEKVILLRSEAKKEYFNHGIRDVSSQKAEETQSVFNKLMTTKYGAILELNVEYPGIKNFIETLNKEQLRHFKMLLQLINVTSNKLLNKHDDKEVVGIEEKDNFELDILIAYIKKLKNVGFSKNKVRELALRDLGFKMTNLPIEISELLNEL